jgi:1-acyl-sn-glycerol-3-phosphate acyltransferase
MDQRLTAFEITERPVQLQGNRLAACMLRLLGWQLHWDGLPARQGVIAVYPHTSNWDMPLAMLAKSAIGLQVTWWGKDSMFRVPVFASLVRALGGRPVRRDVSQGAVGQMTEALREARRHDRFLWLALTPEGTRRRTEGWRTGFYRIAHEAGVPVCLGVLDYGRRIAGTDSFWRTSGDIEADFEVFASRLSGYRGFRSEQAAPVRPLRTTP